MRWALAALLLLAACRTRFPEVVIDEPRIADISAAIGRLRGLPAHAPAQVAVVDGEAMADVLRRLRSREESLQLLRTWAVIDGAFGDPWTDTIEAHIAKLPVDATFAVYSPDDDRVFVAGDLWARLQGLSAEETRDAERIALTHELVHAWQHRRFPQLYAPTTDVDEWTALWAQREGDAEVTTMALTRDRVDPETIDAYISFRWRMAVSGGQDPARRDWRLRYDAATRALSDVVQTHDWQALNELASHPPRSVAALLNAAPAGIAIDPPRLAPLICPDGWKLSVATSVGSFHIPELLKWKGANRLEVDGWRGDRLEICTAGADFAWRWDTQWDSVETSAAFFAAARAHLQRQHPAASLPAGDVARISATRWLIRRDRTVIMAGSSGADG
jgi:hypothetical protein